MVIKDLRTGTPAVRVRGKDSTLEFVFNDVVPFGVLEQDLRRYLDLTGGRFSGISAYANLGSRLLNRQEVEALLRILEEYRISVAELRSAIEPLEQALSESFSAPVGLGVHPAKQRSIRPSDHPDTLLIRHTCRTGTAIRHPGNVVVLGNVNPGAEITASGDVVVVGTLRGLVHAGADGNHEATIVALSLQASQLRIASRIGISPSPRTPAVIGSAPEVAYISGGSITIEPYLGVLPKGSARLDSD